MDVAAHRRELPREFPCRLPIVTRQLVLSRLQSNRHYALALRCSLI